MQFNVQRQETKASSIMSPLLEKHYAGGTAMKAATDSTSVAPAGDELAVLPVPDDIVVDDGVGVGV